MIRLRVAAYQPNGARLGVLPAPVKVQASMVLGDTGALSLEYPETAPRSALLGSPCELAVEVSTDDGATWTEPHDGRYVYLRRKGDGVKRPNHLTAEAAAYSWRLQTAKVLPEGLLNADGKRPFLSASAGTILVTLLQEAQARGALTGLAYDFTTSADSAGQPWAQVITLYYEPGKDYLAILRNLFDQGLVDFRFSGRTLQVFNADTAMARHLDTADPVTDLRYGRDLTEAPYQGTWENLADYAYVQGDNGVTLERTNGSAFAPWGRQEAFISQGGVSDTGTMTTLADAALEGTADERVERTYGLSLTRARWLPLLDYGLGDYVAVGERNTALGDLTAYRVRSLTLTRDDKGVVGGNAVLNDRFVEQDIRTTRRVQGITGGSTLDGGSGARPAPEGPDKTIPQAVTGLATSTAAYLDDQGAPHAQVTLTWSAVTQNTDGTACDDLAYYEVYATPDGGTPVLYRAATEASGGTVSWSMSPFDVGGLWHFKVRAVDTSGHQGAFSPVHDVTMAEDTTAPPQPSTPTATVRLGVVTITWDGLDHLGNPQPADFAGAVLHRSQVNDFTPDGTTIAARLRGSGQVLFSDQAYDSTWHYKIVTHDTSGNESTPSAQVDATTTPLVATDLNGQVVDGANIVPGTVSITDVAIANSVTTRELAAGAVTANELSANAVTADKIAVGAVDAGKIATGELAAGVSIIAGPSNGTHAELTSTGFRVFINDPVDGVPNEVVRMGTGDNDTLAISDAAGNVLATISEAGDLSASSVSSDGDMEVLGQPLLGRTAEFDSPTQASTAVGILDLLPRGVVAYDSYPGGSTYTTRRALHELSFLAERGRTYELRFSGIHASIATANVTTGFGIGLASPDDIPLRYVSTYSVTGNVLTVTTTAAHGYVTGDTAILRDMPDAPLNGQYAITVTSTTTFTASTDSADIASTDGTSTNASVDVTREAPTPNLSGNAPTIMFCQQIISSAGKSVTFPAQTKTLRCNPLGKANGGELSPGINKLLVFVTGDLANFTPSSADYYTLTVADVGPDIPATGLNNSSVVGTNQTTQATKKTYTSVWRASNSESYRGNNTARTDTGDLVQGTDPSGYNGDGHAVVVFGSGAVSGEVGKSIATALSGASLAKVEVYAYANHWYYNAGGTAIIRPYNSTALSSTTPSGSHINSGSWPNPGGRWVNITSIASGSIRGFTLGKSGTSNLTYYGRFNGHTAGTVSTRPQLRLTYTR